MPDSASVYVVDDDEAVLLSAKALLTQHGYEAACFSSAARFLAEACHVRPGCVISDLRMPGMNGLELQQHLIEFDSLLSLVVVTGVADVRTAVTYMENGAVTLLEKPYEPEELLSAIQNALAISRQKWRQKQADQAIVELLDRLSSEERAVMQAMLSDEPNKSIAYRLDVGKRTIDRRRRSVLQKLQVSSVTELACLLASTNANWRRFATASAAPRPDEQG